MREEKRTKQKEEEKRTESKAEKELSDYAKRNDNIKHVSIQADSMDELLAKMKSVDWDVVKAEEIQNSGTKYDFSI
ncbi:MAG: DUF6033 family protein [Clostridium sp.]|nr:DUF6033 family protein [Clostridium sp.]MCM1172571.1 DUF6033 family protein [Clostridium sp.]MCM1208397.1 DUF6033 family protein [Ruminococcus sp.]